MHTCDGVDTAFAVHDNIRSHTDAYATFGKGMIDGSAKRQQINITRSTEAKVAGVHEHMPAILWMRYFLDAQGYPLRPTKVHQDNLSGKQVEKNGKTPSSKKTRYMC